TTFGIPAFINKEIMPIGTELRLLAIEKKYENGELDIKTQGVGVFKTKEFYSVAPGKLYPGADITRLTQTDDSDLILNERILTKIEELFAILKMNKKTPKSPSMFRVYDVAHYIGLNIQQEYGLLTIPTELERQQFVIKHLEKLIPMVKNMEESKRRAQLNGHFKNVKPPKF
ncbi:MAG: peptidase, partial [Bacteroidota bacterium]